MARFWLITVFLLTHNWLHAQLCQGSLGDPVIDITFGAGPNPGPELPSGVTYYPFVGADCPNDGYYTIRNQTMDCFGYTWHDLQNDHTGDPNGYFMLVNASYQPSDFYFNNVSGLCAGTTYEFAAWIINMDRPGICADTAIQPNITFSILREDRSLLKSFNTGSIPPTVGATWTQYGFYFQTSAGDSSVIIRMTNNAPGGCGNDLALDDITFRPCGPDILVSIAGASTDSLNICQGQSSIYTVTSQLGAGYSNPAFQWQQSSNNGQTWTDINNATDSIFVSPQTAPGSYDYRVAAAEAQNIHNPVCRVNSQVVSIDVNPLPSVKVAPLYRLCTNDTMVLAVSGAQTYTWTGPNGFSSPDSVATIPNPPVSASGTYYVSATSAQGCSISDSSNVVVYPAAVANAGTDTSGCQGVPILLSGTGGVSYSWYPATGLSSPSIPNPVAQPADTTTYVLTVTDANGCKATDSVTVNVWQNPTANAGPEQKIFQGQSITLTDVTAGGTGVYYGWQPDYNINNSTLLQPTVYPAQDTTYTLTVSSPYGCAEATSKVFIRVFQKLGIPNAFSPNGDGINDTWQIEKLNTYPEADLYIFNRYGQTIYHTKGNGQPWDGTLNGKHVPFGTYYYMIDLKNGLPKLSGWVEVLY